MGLILLSPVCYVLWGIASKK